MPIYALAPGPFAVLPPGDEPIDQQTFAVSMGSILDQAKGLAGLCYMAINAEYDIAFIRDNLDMGLLVLTEYLRCADDLFERWHSGVFPGTGPAPSANDRPTRDVAREARHAALGGTPPPTPPPLRRRTR